MKYIGSKNRIANEMKLHIKRLKNFLNFLLKILNRLTVVALAYNVPKIGEVGDFGDEIINRSHSTPILPILCYAFGFGKRY